MGGNHRAWIGSLFFLALALAPAATRAAEHDPAYYADGDLAGSLRSSGPLALFDTDPQHLWNRLFAAFYIRESKLPARPDGPPVKRIEGGDWIDFFGWSGTSYWSEPEVCERLNLALTEFIDGHGERLLEDPLRRAVLQRDLWAAFDFLIGQNIERFGTREEQRRRRDVAARLAVIMRALAQPRETLEGLPDNYRAAVASGHFAAEHHFDSAPDYLPPGLLTAQDEWVEIDFYQPNLHEDLADRFITLHTRNYRGRSYFRIFYRFPGGREALADFLEYVDAEGVDWRFAAQNGFIRLKPDVRQVPAGTEVALVQFMMALDDQLRPTPTRIVESVRLRTFANVDGSADPPTNTQLGMNVYEYTLKRRLLFDDLRQGGLAREPDDGPLYRVIFQPRRGGRDWGERGRMETLVQQCASCHTGDGPGVRSLASLVNSGGFDAGAQMGIAVPLAADQPSPRGARAARWKERDETYRRLLDFLEE
jgi:hypothetical protein